jgi:hypothetical protein
LTLVDWFKREVIRLPKWRRHEGNKSDDSLRMLLAEKWYFLRKAVEEVQALRSGQVPKHYFIAQRFLAESLNPATPTDRILADREQIYD